MAIFASGNWKDSSKELIQFGEERRGRGRDTASFETRIRTRRSKKEGGEQTPVNAMIKEKFREAEAESGWIGQECEHCQKLSR